MKKILVFLLLLVTTIASFRVVANVSPAVFAAVCAIETSERAIEQSEQHQIQPVPLKIPHVESSEMFLIESSEMFLILSTLVTITVTVLILL